LHPRRHTDDTLAVLGRRDRARHVRAVRAGVPPRALAVVQLAVGARRGLARVGVVLQLRVLVVHAGVQHAYRDVRRTGGDLPRLVRADLYHVPLHRTAVAGLLLRGSLRDLRVVGLLGDIRGARGADGLHPGGPAYGVGELLALGVRDDHADLVVRGEHRAAVVDHRLLRRFDIGRVCQHEVR